MGAPPPVARQRRRWVRQSARATLRWSARVNPEAALVLGGIAAGIALLATETPIGAVVYDVPLGLAFAFSALHCGSIPLAVRTPVLAVLLSVPASTALQALGLQVGHPWPWWVVQIITQTLVVFVVAVRCPWQVGVAAWLIPIVSSSVLAGSASHDPDPVSVNVIVYASISGAALALALVLAQWNLIRTQLVRERRVTAEEQSGRRLAEDRARIARELHDVIAHSMSMIAVQATTARYRNPQFGEAAMAEFDEIGASSRQALEEMRGLLGVLRHGDEPGERRPQPRFTDIPELIEQGDRAGMHVDFTWPTAIEEVSVSEVTGLAAYRIVQEALSNAIRHAPGARVRVTARLAGSGIDLDVVNEAAHATGQLRWRSGAAGAPARQGQGVIGMIERATSVGGTVTAGPTDDGGFAIRAQLPLHPPPDRQ
jgi:signal transduction histidine kinase